MKELSPEYLTDFLKKEAKQDRHRLYRRFIDQAEGCEIGNAIIVHGYRGNVRAQHFKDLANALDDADFNVASFDLPRFGKSPVEMKELHGQIVSFAELVRSVKSMLFLYLNSMQMSKTRTILVGYSIGALAIIRLLEIYPYLQNYVAGIVLVSAPLRVDHNARKELLRWKAVLRPLFKLLVRVRPRMPVNQYEPDEFSVEDPHHYKGAMDAWTANQILVASEQARAKIKRIRVPILFLHGEDDATAPLNAMEWAYGEVSTPRDDREKIVYKGIDHLLLQKHRRAIEDIVKWAKIRAKLALPPPKIAEGMTKVEERFEELLHIFIELGRRIFSWIWRVVVDMLRPFAFWNRNQKR